MRLKRRLEKLEGGATVGVDIVAEVPAAWPKERQSAEVKAIAAQHGVSGPFGLVILIQRFAGEPEEAQIIFAGRMGADPHLPEPWRRHA